MKWMFSLCFVALAGCGLAGAESNSSSHGGGGASSGSPKGGGGTNATGGLGGGGSGANSTNGSGASTSSGSTGSSASASTSSSSSSASSSTAASSTAAGGPCMSGSTCGQCADCQSCIGCELEPPGNTCWTTNCTDSHCAAFAMCIQGCSNPGCYQGCNRSYPTAAMQAGAATGCACNACAQCQGQCGPPN